MRCLCLAAFLVLAFIPAHAGHTPPTVLLRVHVQTAGDGLSGQQATSVTIPPNGEEIQIRALPDLNEGELVAVVQDDKGLHLQFNHIGQVALSALTAQNQERILVVLLDGIVIYAPVIDQQIVNGELDVPRTVNPGVVKALQDRAARNVRQANKT